ncbi:hypothetical protein KY285_001420 [Solanum tuberosum]|nr:hypothetical protein KY285_001420 [Solanum tuberosum]
MSQSPSSPKKLLDSLNEIDLVAFYTSLDAPSPSKISTISPVNIGETSPLNTQSSLDLNNKPSPCSAMLFNLLFEGDLPKNKSSESNILAVSESLVVESLTQFGVYPSSDSTDTDEDNRPLRWIVQKKMVPISTKEREKVIEETPKKRPFTRSDSKKLMGDAMKSSATTIAERRKERKSSNVLFEIPDTVIVDVSIDGSKNEGVGEDYEEKREKQVKEPSKGKSQGKGKSKASVAKRVVSKKGKNKRKREASHVIKPASGTGPEDGSITTRVGSTSLHMIEDLLGQILEVPREGTRSVIGKTCTVEFVKECSKIPNARRAGIQKKLMKREYQLLYEFVNKFDPIDLPALMLEHMYKTVVEHKGKHGMGYGYFFTKANPLSKVSQLIMEHDQLKHELEEMIVRVSNKEAEIALLKVELLKAQTEGHGTAEVRELRK